MTYSLNCQTALVEQPESYGILLHGYGANGADLIGLAPAVQQILPTMSFIAPDAPDMCAQNSAGFEWFDLDDFSPAARQRGAAYAWPKLSAFLASVTETHQIGYDQLVLIGFSQGAAMSLHAALQLEEAIHAVIGFSGFLPHSNPKNHGATCPIHLVHGDCDPVVPIQASVQAQSTLQALGFQISLHQCAGLTHGINDEGLHSAVKFLQNSFL